MITVTIDPSASNLVKNRMISRYETDRYVTTAATKAKVILTFSSTSAAVAESIGFVTFSQISVTMLFATALDDSGTKLRTNTLALSLADFIEQVATDLAANYYLQDNFVITYNTTTITLTAKVAGNDLTTVCFSSATGIAVTTMTAGVDQVVAPNHRIRVDVLAEDSYGANFYRKLAALEEEPFPEYADFDVSEVLRASFTRPDLPVYNETNVIRCKWALKRFKVTYAEKYGTPPVFKATSTIGPFFAYFAGASFQEFPLEPLLLDYFSAQKYFLTWQPATKYAYSDSQDYLYFYIAAGVTAFRVKVYAKYSDGTDDTTYPWTRTSLNDGEIYRIPAGYKNLVDATGVFDAAKTVVYYEVSVDDNGGTPVILADPFRFRMIYRERYDRQTFIFNNSLPAMETLETTGEIVTGIAVEAFTAEVAKAYSTSLVSEETFKTYAEKQDVFKTSTGWHSKERIDQVIDELFLANHVYLADKDKLAWLPVIINKGSVEKFKSQQDLFAVNFEYTYAFTNLVTEGNISAATSSSISGPLSVTIGETTSILVLDTGSPLSINIQPE